MKIIYLPMLAALAGCMTVPAAPAARSESVRLMVLKSADELRGLVQALADPAAVPGYAGVSATLTEARVAVATEAALGFDSGLAGKAELAALGVTLKLCADGLGKLEARERTEALKLARGEFALTCLGPISWFELG